MEQTESQKLFNIKIYETLIAWQNFIMNHCEIHCNSLSLK